MTKELPRCPICVMKVNLSLKKELIMTISFVLKAILKFIDKILEIKLVQYILISISVLAFILVLVYKSRIEIYKLQLNSANADKAEYGAFLLTQNAAIAKHGEDMQALLDKLKIANSEVKQMQKELKLRQAELSQVILVGDCPQMVQQVLDEVRK